MNSGWWHLVLLFLLEGSGLVLLSPCVDWLAKQSDCRRQSISLFHHQRGEAPFVAGAEDKPDEARAESTKMVEANGGDGNDGWIKRPRERARGKAKTIFFLHKPWLLAF